MIGVVDPTVGIKDRSSRLYKWRRSQSCANGSQEQGIFGGSGVEIGA